MKLKSAPADPPGWETLSRETHFENAHLSVADVEVRSPNEPKTRHWTVVFRKAAVIIAPMTADGKLVLVRQERIPIRAAIWEVPAGQVDLAANGDDVVDGYNIVALRELREETGYEVSAGGEIIPLGFFFSSPGFTDEQGYFFLVRPVEPGADGPAHTDSESILDCRAFSPEEVTNMIASGEIRDANTLGICAKLVADGFLSLHA
ncbi:MAG: NUDIX hydrolase [Chthoniobacterales bacterium]|nr:NUDIX hydrolase [Chthoniobacterales bacterium]